MVSMNIDYRISEIFPTCPYCGEKHDNDDIIYDYSYMCLECKKCGKKSHVEEVVAYDTHGDCELNGKKHDWVGTEHKGQYRCKNCPQWKHD
jgi:hypothetical protein